MKNLLDNIISLLREGEDAVLVSVAASSGSTPRGAGAMMLVRRDGSSVGTIGGGAVEFAAQKHAAEVYALKRSAAVGYDLSADDVANLGMICGGKVSVYFQYIEKGSPEALELFDYLRGAFDRDESVWLVRKTEDGVISDMGVYGKDGLLFASEMTESEIKPLLRSRAVLSGGYYAEPIVRAGRVYIFGGGHVAQQLVPVLAKVGFKPVIFEDREEFSSPELFPAASAIIRGDFKNIAASVSISPADFVVIMTRGHQLDFEVLEQTLRSDAAYIGCIGSSKKVAATKERLAAAGVPQKQIDRMISPIGLEIAAETPEEIAISIAGQMILHRAKNM